MKNGFFSAIKEIITIILFIGLFLALLATFNNDVASMFAWIFDAFFKAVMAVKETALRLRGG